MPGAGSRATRPVSRPERSEPGAKAKGEAHVVDDSALRACVVLCLSEVAQVCHADVGRELAAELVSEPQAGIEV